MKNVQKGTGLTEIDLFRLSDHGGWTVDRAQLSESALNEAFAIVKHLVPAEKRPEFEFWLNELFAQYVEDLQKRAEARRSIDKRPDWFRPRHKQSGTSSRKLTTAVRGELEEIARAILEVRDLIDGLGPPGRTAINAYFKRKGLIGRTRVSLGRRFGQTWRNACDAFLLLQVACERFEEKEHEISSAIQAKLADVSRGFDRLMGVIETLSDPTWKVLRFSYRQLERSGDLRVQPGSGTKHPITDALSWLSLLHSVAAAPGIEVKRGGDEAPAKRLGHGLAALYREMTGKEPTRMYRGIVSRRGDPTGEAGDILELAKVLAKHGNSSLPKTVIGGTQSPSKVIRLKSHKRRPRVQTHSNPITDECREA